MSAFWDKIKKKKEQKEGPKKDSKSSVSVASDEKREKASSGSGVKKVAKNAQKEKQADKKVEKKAKKKIMSQIEAKIANRILVNPKISEASMNQQALGKYVFQVAQGATKNEIAKAIEAFYGVVVEKVNVINYRPKSSNFRGVSGTKKGYRKAIATLKSGQSIDMFKEAK